MAITFVSECDLEVLQPDLTLRALKALFQRPGGKKPSL